jgi:hypothetical protein
MRTIYIIVKIRIKSLKAYRIIISQWFLERHSYQQISSLSIYILHKPFCTIFELCYLCFNFIVTVVKYKNKATCFLFDTEMYAYLSGKGV